MKVFMIGGTGLLGSEAAKVLISRGHEVTAMALPPLPEGGLWCDECERKSWNYGSRAKVDPFFAQVWNPLHGPDELREYPKEVSELDV